MPVNIATQEDFQLFKEQILAKLKKLSDLISTKKSEDEWLTPEEVKQKYKIKSVTTVYKLFTPYKKGGNNLFKKSEIEESFRKNE